MSSIATRSLRTFFYDLLQQTIPLVVGLYGAYRVYTYIQHQDKHDYHRQLKAKQQLKQHLIRQGRLNADGSIRSDSQTFELLHFDNYEERILPDVVFPDSVTVSFDDIGGLSELKQELYESVILPLTEPELFASINCSNQQLFKAPKGVLFYGPPGTGKTMVAKAIASAASATFINVKPSSINNKWFGESQRLIKAVFSVAVKLRPSIIFIDECESFLHQRGGTDGSTHEVSLSLLSMFLQLLDGLVEGDNRDVVVLCATNRPFDLDEAVLRRLTKQFLFELPSAAEREMILAVTLKGVELEQDVDLPTLAAYTENYSGSDLHELCKVAAMFPVKDALRQHRSTQPTSYNNNSTSASKTSTSASSSTPSSSLVVRPVSRGDFMRACSQAKPSGETSLQYLQQWSEQQQNKQKRVFAQKRKQ